MKKLLKILWIATIPLALTFFVATSGFSQEQEPVGHDRNETTAAGEEEVVTNPIRNVADFGYHAKQLPPPFTMQLVNFAILLFLVGRTAGPGIKKYVRERHENIAKALHEGARLRDEAKRKLDEYSAKLAGLDKEIEALTATIRAEAETEKKRIIGEAEARATRILRDAEQQIQAEIERARAAIEREAVEAAIGVAETILREKTTDADQKKLAEGFVKSLEATADKRPQPAR